VQFELDEALATIVPPGPLSSVAFDLVIWAEQRGRTAELIKAVKAARPNNPDIAALGQLLPEALPVDPAVTKADRQRRLRGLLLNQFPSGVDLAILLNDALGEILDQIAGGSNQTERSFQLVQWLWIDKSGRLEPFLAAAVRERPNCAELKALQSEITKG
jgi:hypothetical protein